MEPGTFAHTIYLEKYSMERPDGTKEEWEDTAHRVASAVLDALE